MVYLASPLSAPTEEGMVKNQQLAIKLSKRLIQKGLVPMTPHIYFPLFLNEFNPNERQIGLDMGLVWLNLCQAMYVYTNNGISKGMQGEIEHALKHNIPIYTIDLDGNIHKGEF